MAIETAETRPLSPREAVAREFSDNQLLEKYTKEVASIDKINTWETRLMVLGGGAAIVGNRLRLGSLVTLGLPVTFAGIAGGELLKTNRIINRDIYYWEIKRRGLKI